MCAMRAHVVDAGTFGAMKKKKRDFKLSQNSKNENYHFEFNK